LIARPTTVVLDYVVVHMMTDELGLRNSIASVTQARFAIWVCAVVVQSLIMAGVVAVAAGTVSAIVTMDGMVRDMIFVPGVGVCGLESLVIIIPVAAEHKIAPSTSNDMTNRLRALDVEEAQIGKPSRCAST
jgi:hypothetical protein